MLFTQSDFAKIQQAVQEAEAQTSGEIVVHFTDRSGGYHWVPWAAALLASFSAALVLWVGIWRESWSVSALTLLEGQAMAAALAFALCSWKPIHQKLVPRAARALRVREQALAHFVLSGVSGTKHRTGILVFLSEFERGVEIVADSAIHQVCGADFWSVQAKSIASGIGSGRSVDAVCQAVREMGQRLADKFPRQADDVNELPDGPTEGKFR